MRIRHPRRLTGMALALGAFGVIASAQLSAGAENPLNVSQDGKLGFVLYQFNQAGADGDQVCPRGRSLGFRQIFERSPEGQRREGETDQQYSSRVQAGSIALGYRNGQNLCAHPELGGPDPYFRTMDDTRVAAYGIDLDGRSSTRHSRSASGACAQDNFRGADGRLGVDNQYLRLTGCTGQPTTRPANAAGWLPPRPDGVGQENTMLEGGWGVLIALRGVDNLRNDDSVEVGIYANNDPIQLTPARDAALPDVTYAPDQDPRFRAEAHGRIVNGVLTTEPVDVRFHWLVAGMHLERPLRHARIEARFTGDGQIEGYLAGYTPVEALYDMQYGFRNAKTDDGRPVPSAQTGGLAILSASAIGRTCYGAYDAAYALADGDRDSATGRCTSISTQYVMRGIRAFVVDVQTRGANDSLVRPEDAAHEHAQ